MREPALLSTVTLDGIADDAISYTGPATDTYTQGTGYYLWTQLPWDSNWDGPPSAMQIGNGSKGIITFSLPDLGPGATVTSATLTLPGPETATGDTIDAYSFQSTSDNLSAADYYNASAQLAGSFTANLGQQPPTVNLAYNVNVTAAVSAWVQSPTSTSMIFRLEAGGKGTVFWTDYGSGIGATDTLTIDYKSAPAVTTTTVASSINPSAYGQPVTFTATVAANSPGAGTPTGSVQFAIDGTDYGGPVALSSGMASFSDAALTAAGSPHTVTADYTSSDGNFSGSSGSLQQVVTPAVTTTTVASSTNPSVYGQPVTFTATVAANSPDAGTPTGSVQFAIDGTDYGGPVALSSGTASFSDAALTVAGSPHTVTAVYTSSDGNFSGSSGSLQQFVTPANTTTTVASSVNPSVYGQVVTFTATVAANSPDAGTPTGSVQFAIDGTDYGGPVALSSGTASFSDAALTAAGSPHTVTAVYTDSDGNFSGSSGSLQQFVTPANTTTTVASSVNPSAYGEPVTFTAIVAADGPDGGTPTGSVQFAIDGTNYGGPVELSSGAASTSDAALTAAGSPHTVTAIYTDSDGNFSGSSGSLQQVVTPANTTTAVASSAKPSKQGQQVTFTATVAANAPGAGTPTGSVQFAIDGANYGGPVALSSGSASTSDAALTAAGSPHTVTAVYTDSDGNFSGSSGSLQQVVTLSNKTTPVHPSPNPPVLGYPQRKPQPKPPSKGPSKGPAKGPSKGPARGPSRGPAKGPAKGPSKGPSKGPAKGPAKGPSKGPAKGP